MALKIGSWFLGQVFEGERHVSPSATTLDWR